LDHRPAGWYVSLMTRVKTGVGWGESKDEGPKHSLILYNFDIDWAELKEEHKKHLRVRAVPLLKADPTRIAWVTGKASRTGNEEHNLALSNQRAESVNWSRNASQTPPRKIVVGGTDYQVTASAVDDSGRRGAVFYTIELGIFSDRSCNWGVVLPGWGISYVVPIEDERDGRETGAHEFGHSVLKDGWGYAYSLKHKGTSTAWQSNVGPAVPSPPAEIDLMKYYNFKDPSSNSEGYYQRVNAIEDDVKALLATVRLQFTSDV
jgi:OmpA family